MPIVKTILLLILFNLHLNANTPIASLTPLCFTLEKPQHYTFCPKESTPIHLTKTANFEAQVTTIQEHIRTHIQKNPNQKLILMGSGLEGSLLAVAQTNLLPYYRNAIDGLVLHNTPANFYRLCKKEKFQQHVHTCKQIKQFQLNLNGLASYEEVLKSLSPLLQIDNHWPKTVLLQSDNIAYKQWEEAFDRHYITYTILPSNKPMVLSKHFSQPKTKPIIKQQPKPHHHGATLRYHLWKISYTPKHTIVSHKNIAYGKEKAQQYDLFYKEGSQNNPLILYIHGGGWSLGDKLSFQNFCKQAADRGFTAVSINYRLMKHPNVGK
jgi:hypothetical protein